MKYKTLICSCITSAYAVSLAFSQITQTSVFKYTFESDDASSSTLATPPDPLDGPIEEDFTNLPNDVTNPNPDGTLPDTAVVKFRFVSAAPDGQDPFTVLPLVTAVGGTLFDPNAPATASSQYLSMIFDSYDPDPRVNGAGKTTVIGISLSDGVISDGANTSRVAPLVPFQETGPAPSLEDLIANPRNYAIKMKIRSVGYDGGTSFPLRLFFGHYDTNERGFETTFSVSANTAEFQTVQRRLSNFTPNNLAQVNPSLMDFKLQLPGGDSQWGSTPTTGVNNRVDVDDYEIVYSPIVLPTPTPSVSLGGTQTQYFQNFDTASITDPIDGTKIYFTPNGWTIPDNYWSNELIPPSGVNQFVGTGGNTIGVYDPVTMLTSNRYRGTEPTPAPTYPRPPLLPVRSYSEFGFTGSWLANSARALSPNAGAAAGSQNAVERKASLQLTDLPTHSFIDIQALMGYGGSLDGRSQTTTNEQADYYFRVLVDGVQVTSTTNGYAPQALVSGANLMPLYHEEWAGNNTTTLNWTLHSAYDLSLLNSLKNIPHTAPSVTIDFLHGSDDNSNDELIAIDNVNIRIKNNDVTRTIPNWGDVVPNGGLVYEQNFNAAQNIGGDTSEWELNSGWVQQQIINDNFIVGSQAAEGNNTWGPVTSPSGLISILQTANVGTVAAEPVGVVYPVPPIIPPTAPSSLGFAGKWINSTGVSTQGNGLAVLEFKNLPTHTSIDLDFKLIFGGSLDSVAEDGIKFTDLPEPMKTLDTAADPFGSNLFGVRVLNAIGDTDREVDFGVPNGSFKTDTRFNPTYRSVISGGVNGMLIADQPGIYPLIVAANMFDTYREFWAPGPNGEDPAPDINSRKAIGWTPSNAYNVKHASRLTNIAHTASTLRIEFLHGLSENFGGEQVAIDDVKLTLNTGAVDPDPVQLTISEWKQQVFTAAEQANAAISGDNADPDCDNLPNLLEYGIGSDPMRAETYPAWATNITDLNGGNPVVSVYKSPVATGVNIRAQKSTNLSAAAGGWVDLGDATEQLDVGSDPANGTLMRFTDSEFNPGSTVFYRVIAIQN